MHMCLRLCIGILDLLKFMLFYSDFIWQEKLNSGPSLDQKRSDLGDSEIGNRESEDLMSYFAWGITRSVFGFLITFFTKSCTDLLNEEAQVEQNSNSKPLSVEVDNLQEGKHEKIMKKTVRC